MQRIAEWKKRREVSEPVVGVMALGLVAIVTVITTYFYVMPPDQQTVTFTTHDAVSLRGGEDVRIAGVSVGKVKDLRFDGRQVTVGLSVGSSVELGDRTRVEVRLLTAVGGYFVTLVPLGRAGRAGHVSVPIERVTMPYTIADTLQQLPRVTGQVTGVPIDKILEQINSGLGANPEALRNVVSGMQTLATVLDRQKQQVQSTLGLVSEYSSTFNASRDFVFTLANKINVVLSTYHTYRAGFSEAFSQLGQVLLRIGALSKFYVNHETDLAQLVERVRSGAGRLRDGMDDLINNLTPLQQRLKDLVGPQFSGGNVAPGETIDGSAICLPVAGRAC
ncbi:MlaD family protein [Nocardia sp. R7R-8]|uniref:MlaD family protein n=1 Tax=Nocardia sp. R7R-8 TaxID=3459304 RepID=UPI00403DF7AB